jgi:hypothetical protein
MRDGAITAMPQLAPVRAGTRRPIDVGGGAPPGGAGRSARPTTAGAGPAGRFARNVCTRPEWPGLYARSDGLRGVRANEPYCW